MAKGRSVSAQSTTISDWPTPRRRNQTAPGDLWRWHRDTTYADRSGASAQIPLALSPETGQSGYRSRPEV